MARKKMTLIPGKRYKGVGWLNEYGQVGFEPYQKAEKSRGMKVVKETDSFTLYESINCIKISVKIEKSKDKWEMVRGFMDAFTLAAKEVKNYNFD